MDILVIALLGVPLFWMALSPATFWHAALSWQYRDRQQPQSTTAVRATGIIGLVTIGIILTVLIVQRVQESSRSADCRENTVPEVTRILTEDRARLEAALTEFGVSRGWSSTTIDGVSTTFRDGSETVLIVQHDPGSSSPVTCW